MKSLAIAFVCSLLATPALAVEWRCSGDGQTFVVDTDAVTAQLNGQSVPLRQPSAHQWASGERSFVAGLTAPASWAEGSYTRDAYLTLRFNKVRDAYEAKIQRFDGLSGGYGLFAHVSMTCDLPRD